MLMSRLRDYRLADAVASRLILRLRSLTFRHTEQFRGSIAFDGFSLSRHFCRREFESFIFPHMLSVSALRLGSPIELLLLDSF